MLGAALLELFRRRKWQKFAALNMRKWMASP
jgi:hypothetical protein